MDRKTFGVPHPSCRYCIILFLLRDRGLTFFIDPSLCHCYVLCVLECMYLVPLVLDIVIHSGVFVRFGPTDSRGHLLLLVLRHTYKCVAGVEGVLLFVSTF